MQNKLINQYQSGFLPKHSSVHQLIELYNTILNSLEKKELCCFVICDFSKAFDKVWHKGLIHKMNCYGIKGNLLKWFENYRYCRHQKVVNRDSSSSYMYVSAMVQGSVLRPLLFLVYIYNIGDKLLSLSRLFADDTTLGYICKSRWSSNKICHKSWSTWTWWLVKEMVDVFQPRQNWNHAF